VNHWQKVISIHQSPLNPQQWCLGLECGHDIWVTTKREPKAKEATCEKCARKEEVDNIYGESKP
jgi:hypothetical protein